MSIELLDEHERSEHVRDWLRRNGSAILIGILLGLGALYGYGRWQDAKTATNADAQMAFHALLKAQAESKTEDVQRLSGEIRERYGSSEYAVLAGLQQAQASIKQGDVAAADATLAWAVKQARLPALKALAQLRLAKAKLAQNQADAALKLADAANAPGFTALAQEIRGDALLALGRADDARKAYDLALADVAVGASVRSTLEMKRDGVSVAAVVAAPAPEAAPVAAPPAGATAAPAAAPVGEGQQTEKEQGNS
jgi:predicted negative regulator of RcsB-dependent stress response